MGGKNMQLVDRTLNALMVLSRYPEGISVNELSGIMRLPASTTHRVLNSLKENNFVIQDEKSKLYRLSYKVLTLTGNMNRNNVLIMHAHQKMMDLSERTRKTIVLAVREENSMVYMDVINYGNEVFVLNKGQSVPVFRCSTGRAAAAFLPEDELEGVIRATDFSTGTRLVNDEESFRRALEHIRACGYAVIDEELKSGVQGVSVPLFDGEGNVIAALAFATYKKERAPQKEDIDELKKCAEQISASLS